MGAWYGGVPCIEGSLYKWYVALMTAGIDVALDIKVI